MTSAGSRSWRRSSPRRRSRPSRRTSAQPALALHLLAQDSFVQDLRGSRADRVLVCAVRMFDDVYDELPLHLQEQKEEVQAFRERFPDAFHGH